MKIWVFTFFCLQPFLIFGFDDNDLSTFFFHVKSLEFSKARSTLNSITDKDIKNELSLHLDILYFEGQNQNDIVLIDKDDAQNKKTYRLQILRLLNQGYHSLFNGELAKLAYKNFYQAYELANTYEDPILQKTCLLAFLKYYNFEIAQNSNDYLNYLQRFKQLKTDQTDAIWITIYEMIFHSKSLTNLDTTYYKLAKKLNKYEQILSSDSPLLGHVYYEKAMQYNILNNNLEAKRFYKKAIAVCKPHPFLKKIVFFSYIKLMVLETDTADFLNARAFLDSAQNYINIADPLRSSYYVNLYKSLLLNAQKKNDSAYDLLMQAYRQEFQLDYRRNTLEVNRLNVELETQQKERQILKEQQRAISNRNWFIAASVTLILGIGIAILLYKNTAKKRKLAEQQQQIEHQKVVTLLKEQELHSIDAMIAGQEKERIKVANELHDDLGSLMATVKLHFDNVKVDQKDPALKNAQRLLDEAYQKIRTMAHAKNSGVMANQGLVPAVKKMAKTISETNALQITVEDFGLNERLENALELTIFRIIQELITNIIKHAEATKASIQFTQHEDNLNIIVEDNGKGFDIAEVKRKDNGMGLGSIEKRIEFLEGSFTVDSILHKGTSILIDIPV